jgi:hypothetical protein
MKNGSSAGCRSLPAGAVGCCLDVDTAILLVRSSR